MQCRQHSHTLFYAESSCTYSLLSPSGRGGRWGQVVIPGREWADRARGEHCSMGAARNPSQAPGGRVSPARVMAAFKELPCVASRDVYLSIPGISFPRRATRHLILLWCLLLQAILSLWLYIHLWHLNKICENLIREIRSLLGSSHS